MSIATQRMPLQTIQMNKLPSSPARDDKMSTMTVTKGNKRKKDYDQESDGFVFTKSKRAKASRDASVQPEGGSAAPGHAPDSRVQHIRDPSAQADDAAIVQNHVRQRSIQPDSNAPLQRRPRELTVPSDDQPRQESVQVNGEYMTAKRRRLPATPEPETRRPAQQLAPSPNKTVTVEKRRKTGTSRILLPASDTPIIRRNKALRETMNERRRSSSGMRGRRASSMIDEGKWNAQPHPEVHASDFYTMISSNLIEPRRMRLLLGWCGDRALPQRPQAPSNSSKQASEEFQAIQAARIIQEELSKDFCTDASLSEWFSRDTEVPQSIVLHKRPNPRNILNAAKVEELEEEVQRLRSERQAWDTLLAMTPTQHDGADAGLSPPHTEFLSPSQQEILAQLQTPDLVQSDIERQLHDVSASVEFVVDQLSHSINAVTAASNVAERIADRSLRSAADALKKREREHVDESDTAKIDALDALRGLARVLNDRRQ